MSKAKSKGREEVRGILAQFTDSGLTQREFAAQEGVPVSTLVYWLRRDRVERELSESTSLVEVSPDSVSKSEVGFILECGGFRLTIPRDATVDEWKCLRESWSS